MDNPERWIFTSEQLTKPPSIRFSMSAQEELFARQKAANSIQDMGDKLELTQQCIDLAIIYMHRFYMCHSFTMYHRSSIAIAALFLAAKVDEQPRKMQHVIRAAIKTLNLFKSVYSQRDYEKVEEDLLQNEGILLQTLGFNLNPEFPQKHLARICDFVHAPAELTKVSDFLASNSLHLTKLSLQYKPTVIACFSFDLACRWCRWKIPLSDEGKPWFSYVDKSVTSQLMDTMIDQFLKIYEISPTKLRERLTALEVLSKCKINITEGGQENQKKKPIETLIMKKMNRLMMCHRYQKALKAIAPTNEKNSTNSASEVNHNNFVEMSINLGGIHQVNQNTNLPIVNAGGTSLTKAENSSLFASLAQGIRESAETASPPPQKTHNEADPLLEGNSVGALPTTCPSSVGQSEHRTTDSVRGRTAVVPIDAVPVLSSENRMHTSTGVQRLPCSIPLTTKLYSCSALASLELHTKQTQQRSNASTGSASFHQNEHIPSSSIHQPANEDDFRMKQPQIQLMELQRPQIQTPEVYDLTPPIISHFDDRVNCVKMEQTQYEINRIRSNNLQSKWRLPSATRRCPSEDLEETINDAFQHGDLQQLPQQIQMYSQQLQQEQQQKIQEVQERYLQQIQLQQRLQQQQSNIIITTTPIQNEPMFQSQLQLVVNDFITNYQKNGYQWQPLQDANASLTPSLLPAHHCSAYRMQSGVNEATPNRSSSVHYPQLQRADNQYAVPPNHHNQSTPNTLFVFPENAGALPFYPITLLFLFFLIFSFILQVPNGMADHLCRSRSPLLTTI